MFKRRENENTGESGVAAVEFALFLPLLAALLAVMVEGTSVFMTRYTLLEASREGARLVLRAGDTANVGALVTTLTDKLPEAPMNTSVSMAGGDSVTVRVDYEYQPFLFPESNLFDGEAIVLSAQTTMPLP